MAQQNGDARFDARRKQIVDGLMKCMQTKPYQKISIKEIAQAAGLSHGLLHYYFSSKDEILYELVRVTMRDYLSSVKTLSERLDRGESASGNFFDNLTELAHLYFCDEKRSYFPPYCFIWMMSNYDETLRSIVREAYQESNRSPRICLKFWGHMSNAGRTGTAVTAKRKFHPAKADYLREPLASSVCFDRALTNSGKFHSIFQCVGARYHISSLRLWLTLAGTSSACVVTSALIAVCLCNGGVRDLCMAGIAR